MHFYACLFPFAHGRGYTCCGKRNRRHQHITKAHTPKRGDICRENISGKDRPSFISILVFRFIPGKRMRARRTLAHQFLPTKSISFHCVVSRMTRRKQCLKLGSSQPCLCHSIPRRAMALRLSLAREQTYQSDINGKRQFHFFNALETACQRP